MLKLLYLNGKNYLMLPVLSEYTYLPENFTSHFHIHNVYHLVFILDGRGGINNDNSSVCLSPGDVLIINPGEKHIFSTEASHLNYFTINFYLLPATDNEAMEEAVKSSGIAREARAEVMKFERLFNVKSENSLILYNHEYFDSINHDIISFRGNVEGFGGFSPDFYYINKCLDFLTGIMSKYFLSESLPNSPKHCPDIIVKKIVSYIDSNIDKKLELKLLSEKLGYNPAYLSGHFSKKTGMTISEYHNNKRLEKACLYLRNTKIKITEIALRLGYSSSQHFSAAFKAYKGVHPRDYRNNIEL